MAADSGAGFLTKYLKSITGLSHLPPHRHNFAAGRHDTCSHWKDDETRGKTMKHALFSLIAFGSASLTATPTALASEQVTDLDCTQAEITVYFKAGEATLTEQAERMLDALAAQTIPCTLASVETDARALDAAPGDARDELAEARELAVLSALAERGLMAGAQVKLASEGDERDANMPTGRAVLANLKLLGPAVS